MSVVPPSNPNGLEKVAIRYQTGVEGSSAFAGEVVALFNPRQLRYTKDVTWKIQPITGQATLTAVHQVSFCATKPKSLVLDLYFDTYEGDPTLVTSSSILARAAAIARPLDPRDRTPTGVNVRRFTDPICALANVNSELHQPPVCQLWWGKQLLLQGVLTHLVEVYSLFLADGTPVRATLTCTFAEAIERATAGGTLETASADIDKRRVLRRGDTLSSIAQEMYNDATRWRVIAEANGITNPRRLDAWIGRGLLIPKIASGT